MKPWVHAGNFIWNIDCSVGQHAQNSLAADVMYAQWYYSLAARNPNPNIDQNRRRIYQAVRVTGTCSGRPDDPLVAAILAQQEVLQHVPIDGKLSVAKGDGKIDGSHAFFVFRLGARFAEMFNQVWPRLDLIPECPSPVREAALAALPSIKR